MIERKDDSAGSAFGPIIVMIDANRLGHSLATALKDRPHGIPVQPNRSLPLRPPPPTPVRISLTKSPKKCSITQAAAVITIIQESSHNDEDLGTGITKSNTKHGKSKSDDATSFGSVGINFYDSKEIGDSSNDTTHEKLSRNMLNDPDKFQHSKSLDNDGSYESKHEDRRRESSGHETLRRDCDSKRRNTSDFELPESSGKIISKDKERRNSFSTKRKSSTSDAIPDLSKKEKAPRVENSAVISQDDAKDNVSESKDSDRVGSSGIESLRIYKYRNTQSNSLSVAERNMQASLSTYKFILPKPTNNVPKCPVTIPIEVARAINQADTRIPNIHTGKNDTDVTKTQIGIVPVPMNKCVSTKPKINNIETSGTLVPAPTGYIENTLPSMPTLDDIMQADSFEELFSLHSGPVDSEDVGLNVASELPPMAQSKVLQLPEDLRSQTNNSNAYNSLQENMQSTISDQKFNQPHESVVDNTKILEIHFPDRSPHLLVSQTPQIMPNDGVDNVANQSPVEATTPISLSSGIQPALVEPEKISELNNLGPLSELREDYQECHTSQEKSLLEKEAADIVQPSQVSLTHGQHQQQSKDLSGKVEPQHVLQHQSPVEYETGIEDTSDLHQESGQEFEDILMSEKQQETTKNAQNIPKLEDIKRCRKNRLMLKLAKHVEEEHSLNVKMSETGDPSRLTRLQQKINCAKKKIENTLKYLNKLTIVENPESQVKPASVRIQVRRDLVRVIPSSESADPPLLASLHLTNGTDKVSTTTRQPDSPPVIITISETDSASSDEESEADGTLSPVNVKPYLQLRVEKNIPEYGTKVVSSTWNPPPPDRKTDEFILDMSLESTNNNVEYSNKNLPPICEDVSMTVNTPSTSLPRFPASADTEATIFPLVPLSSNTDSMNIPRALASAIAEPMDMPRVPTSLNTDSMNISRVSASANIDLMSIPQGPPSANTGSMSIPRLPASANTDWTRLPPLIRDPPNTSQNNLNGVASQGPPSIQYGVQNMNLPPAKVDNECSKPWSDCEQCLGGNNSTAAINNAAKFGENNFVPSTVNDLRTPNTIRRTTIDQNTNLHPAHRIVYPSTRANVPSMLSRDNGGANINLSSPLQGHSALPVPPPYYRNLTAQGYPMPAEPSLNQQTAQWPNKRHPMIKSSTPYTPDNQDAQIHPSILAHLLKPGAEESAGYASSMQPSSLVQNKDVIQNEPVKHMSKQIMAAQFPTLHTFAAQLTRESSSRELLLNSTADQTGYVTTGSDMYETTATAINHTQPTKAGSTIHWPLGRPSPEQPRPSRGFSSQRNMPQPYQSNSQQRRQMPQNVPNVPPPGYSGSPVFVSHPQNSYHQVPSAVQNIRSMEHPGSQHFHVRQSAQQYQQHLPSSTRHSVVPHQNQVNSAHLANSIGMIPQQYFQLPPSYVQSMYQQWPMQDKYHTNYANSQYNGFNAQSKTMDNNSILYRQTSENRSVQMQQLPQARPDNSMKHHSIQKMRNVILPQSIHNMSDNFHAIMQDEGNVGALDTGNYFDAPHLGKARRGSDRSNILQCSLCGNIGAKFSCLGCKSAFYCNQQCQIHHWDAHFLECGKKMPKLKKVSSK